MGRYRNKYGASAPVLWNQLILCQLLFHPLDIGAGFIDLVDCHNNLHTSRLGMVDGFYGLRHDTVVGCHHQNSDIRRLGATHTHGGKCLVSRSIQEGDLFSVDLYHIRSDVLGDASCLMGCDIFFPDGIQKRRFTVVNMTHNTDYRRALLHGFFWFLILFQKFRYHIYFLFHLGDDIKLQSDLFCLFKGNILVQGNDLPLHKQFFHQRSCRHLHLIRQLTNRQALWNRNLLDGLFRLFCCRLRLDECTLSVRIFLAADLAHLFLAGLFIGSLFCYFLITSLTGVFLLLFDAVKTALGLFKALKYALAAPAAIISTISIVVLAATVSSTKVSISLASVTLASPVISSGTLATILITVPLVSAVSIVILVSTVSAAKVSISLTSASLASVLVLVTVPLVSAVSIVVLVSTIPVILAATVSAALISTVPIILTTTVSATLIAAFSVIRAAIAGISAALASVLVTVPLVSAVSIVALVSAFSVILIAVPLVFLLPVL